jgi:hypothetical protein
MSIVTMIQRTVTRFRLSSALYRLNQLQNKIFFIYLKRNYSEKHYFYEKELHQDRLRYFSVIVRLYQSSLPKKTLEKMDELFEIITSMGNLRYRLKDDAIFEVCELELLNTTQAISRIFHLLMKNKNIDTSDLFACIQSLESIYQRTLAVVLKEPVLFLIFIHDLYALKEKFDLIDWAK